MNLFLSGLFYCLLSCSLLAQGEVDHQGNKDSIKTYSLEQITVKADKQLESRRVLNIEYKEIEMTDAVSADALGKLIPSVKVQTNSRGETLFFLRGAGERQIMLFLDDVPLNIPWDNRIDMSFIPAEIVGQINVTKGIPSVIYGANAIGGVVNVFSKTYEDGKSYGKLLSQFGANNSGYLSGIYLNSIQGLPLSYLISSSYHNTDGYTLSQSFSNAQANPSTLRLNSQSRSFDIFAKINYKYTPDDYLGLSLSYIDAKKGVPPETNVANPRFWKYPVWQRFGVNIGGEHNLTSPSGPKLRFIFDLTNLKSQIDQYTDGHFAEIDDVEKDNDLTASGRIIFSTLAGSSSILKVALNGITSSHKEIISSEGSTENFYSQNILSLGTEYEYFINNITIITGVSYDFSSTPETGNKPSKDNLHDYSINADLVYTLNELNSLHLSLGRKTRFPTLRECFSGALGRFIPNPGLKAESAISAETGLTSSSSFGKFDLNLFLTYLNDGIVRESLPGQQFQRVNKDVIRSFGFEASLKFYPASCLSGYFHFTYLSSAAKNENGDFTDTLEYKPGIISLLSFLYSLPEGIETMVEFNYTGSEFSLQEGNPFFHPLPDYLLINFRISYKFELGENSKLELFGRVNNLFDKLYYSQWSLPEAGRNFWGGASIEF